MAGNDFRNYCPIFWRRIQKIQAQAKRARGVWFSRAHFLGYGASKKGVGGWAVEIAKMVHLATRAKMGPAGSEQVDADADRGPGRFPQVPASGCR